VNTIEMLNLLNPKPEDHHWHGPTRAENWLDRIGFGLLLVVVCFAIFYRWPRLVLLLVFPTFIPFIRVLAYYARNLGERWMRKVVVEFVFVHSLAMLGALYLWRTVPMISRRVDYALIDSFLIVLVESCVIGWLLRFQRPKG